jgi:polysaccharide biosynthesis protein PslJ
MSHPSVHSARGTQSAARSARVPHARDGLGFGTTQPAEYGFLDKEWLQALVQGGGAVRLVGMIVLVAGGILGVAAALRGATTRRERDQAYMMGAMLIGLLASSYTFDFFSYQQASLVFFLLFGLLWSNFTISFPEATTTSPLLANLYLHRIDRV